ncbi:MAG: hypothetical protein HQK55_12785, partial [Deltaproteobacteria bacterium]|nr:hypothetical protein [Deltaproteobacteria bacterium]
FMIHHKADLESLTGMAVPNEEGHAVHLIIDPETSPDDPIWSTARQRVLLYLQATGLPADLQLKIAVEALGKARSEANDAQTADSAVTLTMKTLIQIMSRYQTGSRLQTTTDNQCPRLPKIVAQPEINRTHMPPANLECHSWGQVFRDLFWPAQTALLIGYFKTQIISLGLF